jgi:glutamine synthetase adenylyltransferase
MQVRCDHRGMNELSASTDPAAPATRALQRLRAGSPDAGVLLDSADNAAQVSAVAVASDFAIATLLRQPHLLAALLSDCAVATPPPSLDADNRSDWSTLLRRYRAAESTRLVWRDVLGHDDVDATLAGSTALAERCLQTALAALEVEFAQRHGVLRDASGSVQRLVVFGLGKLGGGELNFSSDVDLVYAYEHAGDSTARDRSRPRTTSQGWGSSWQSCSTKSPPKASATASTCACVPTAMPGGWHGRLRRWNSISSARGATGSATPGRRHDR